MVTKALEINSWNIYYSYTAASHHVFMVVMYYLFSPPTIQELRKVNNGQSFIFDLHKNTNLGINYIVAIGYFYDTSTLRIYSFSLTYYYLTNSI